MMLEVSFCTERRGREMLPRWGSSTVGQQIQPPVFTSMENKTQVANIIVSRKNLMLQISSDS